MIRTMVFVIAVALSQLLSADAAFAQQPAKIPRVGVLINGYAPDNPATASLRSGLAQLGYVEGKTILIEDRYAEGKLDRMPALAAELISLDVDVIATYGGPAANAAFRANKTIPIVFAIVADPVALGFASTLERPGGNATGSTNHDPRQPQLQLAMLKELLPRLQRIVILSDQDIPGADASGLAPIERTAVAAAQELGLQSQVLKLRGPSPDLEAAFKTITAHKAEALLVLEVPVTLNHRKRIAEMATAQKLPSICPAAYSDAGALISYGTSVMDTWPAVPGFIDKILKGAKPADLPVQVITRRELTINAKTAHTLGLSIPAQLLRQADRVVD
ncbi:MAG: ABC transporter substrate-binding protein [Rhodospirillaceae bacterium]